MPYDELYTNTLKSIYSTPKFKQYQEEFEVRLGNYAYTHHKSLSAVNEGLDKLKNTLYERYKKDTDNTPERTDENSNSTYSYDDNSQGTSSFYSDINESSDLRKKVTAFYNIANAYNSPTKYENLNITKPGTTSQMLNTCKYIGINSQEKLLNFRLALIGCLLPERKQSLHDILDESHLAGVKGKEDLTDFAAMDESVSPLEKKEIVDNCGESLLFNLNRKLGNLTDQQLKEKFYGQMPFENFSDKLLPLDEYICSRFVAASEDEMQEEDDDTNLSLLATAHNLMNDQPETRSLPSVERVSAFAYGSEMYEFMNKKLYMTLNKFKSYLINPLKEHIYFYLLSRLIDEYIGDQAFMSTIGPQLCKKLQESLAKSLSSTSYLALLISQKNSYVKFVNEKIANFVKAMLLSRDSYDETSKEEYFRKNIDSFCKTTADELVNKYITQRFFDDIDILNYGLTRYFKSSPKYSGTVYSGRSIAKNFNITEGQIFTMEAQISTSKNPKTAISFVKDETETKNPSFWIIQLHGDNAVDFSSVSPYPEEEEVLVPAGTKLQVEHVYVQDIIDESYHKSNVTFIFLTEVEN